MINKKYVLPLLAVMALGSRGAVALAADDSIDGSKMKVEDISGNTNTVPGAESVDDMITNNKLRALSGSKSRWSFSSSLNYDGGTVDHPLSQDRPNISASSATTTKSDLNGSLSAKYNLGVQDSLSAGVGVRWIAPTAVNGPKNYNGTVFDVSDPYAQYQRIYKWLGVQSVLQTSVTQYTRKDITPLGYAQSLGVSQENMYEFGTSGLTFGAAVQAGYNTFNKSGSTVAGKNDDGSPHTLGEDQSLYSVALYPVLEYQLTQSVNLRTLIAPFTYEHYVKQTNGKNFTHDTTYQSVGVGIAITRDVFLYPNVQFLPGDMKMAKTNVGLGATINVF